MASLGVNDGGRANSFRISKLVTEVHSAPDRLGTLSSQKRGNSMEKERAVGALSEEEEEMEGSSEDEDELLRTATRFTPYEEEEEESVQSHNILFEAQALSNFEGEEDGDLGFKEREILTILESSRDDGWLLAENALGQRGLVPSNYIKQLSKLSRAVSPADQGGASITPRRGRDLWSKLRQNVKQTSLADVLNALGAIPSGFRESTMAKLLADSPTYLMSTWVMPRPSLTAMAFRDLKWNHSGDYLQPSPAKTSREVAIIMARMIPLPGKGITVLSRHVRVAIFNKNDMLSNIHTVKAVWSSQEEKTWKFIPTSRTATSSLYHRVCTVRVNSSDTNLELLFELGITFKRQSTGEKGEISCGWSSLPLFDHTGNPTLSRTYELKVHGGTPFESGTSLDASAIKASGTGLLPSILRARQMPRLYVRLMNSSRSKKALQSLLPSTIVTASTYIQTIGCFRHLVGVACLRGRLGLPLQSSIVKPSLNVFMNAIDQPDVMDNLLVLFQEKLKLAKRGNKQNLGYLSEQLECILLQQIYPLLNSPSFPPPTWGSETVEKERLKFIEKSRRRTDLSALLAPDVRQTILNISEQIVLIYP